MASLYMVYPSHTDLDRWIERENKNGYEISRIARYLKEKGFVESDRSKFKLSIRGYEIWKEYQSLEKYFKHERDKREKEINRQQIADEKAEKELKYTKWLYKTRWWPLIISALSLIVAAFALLFSLGVL